MLLMAVANPTHFSISCSGQRASGSNFFSSSNSVCKSPLLQMPFNPAPGQPANKISIDFRFWPRNCADAFELNNLSTMLMFCQKKPEPAETLLKPGQHLYHRDKHYLNVVHCNNRPFIRTLHHLIYSAFYIEEYFHQDSTAKPKKALNLLIY